jgi:hypothetical protein
VSRFRVVLLILAAACLGGTCLSARAAEAIAASRVNFHTPVRQYQRAPGDLGIYLEQSLVSGDKALSDAALGKLVRSLNEIFAVLPTRSVTELRRIRFFLMWEAAPEGGRRSGMAYIRQGEPLNHPELDPRWNHVIVIYSARNLMDLDAIWSKKALMHELAHAWHITHWPEKYPPIYTAYLTAETNRLYRNVRDTKGKLIRQAYATRNQLEYFAELSAMYFVGGDYFPFNRAGIAQYDKTGEQMVRQLWGL